MGDGKVVERTNLLIAKGEPASEFRTFPRLGDRFMLSRNHSLISCGIPLEGQHFRMDRLMEILADSAL